jgi:DDE superfamily endonuclease
MTTKNNTQTSELELCDLLVLVSIISVSISLFFNEYESCQQILYDIDSSIRRQDYNYSNKKKRKIFSEIIDPIDKSLFHRMFRCHKVSFYRLVDKIKSRIDASVFKSEEWLIIHNKKYSSAISGEVKIACTIRMLAGASYLDLLLSYGISSYMLYDIFHQTIQWINNTFVFPLPRYLIEENTEKLQEISELFSNRSNGIINGCIGAIDGIAIRIRSPNIIRDDVPDPGNYYCRKGFFALNAQAICDSKKRIIWLSSGHKGSTHDSLAFSETKLIDLLEKKKEYLYKHRLFLIGDSAYAMQSYMIVPFPNADANTMQDDFNYYHSKTRIHIECAFGEIIMRWGIFWRKLSFNLQSVGPIINACCYLHNFLVDERTEDSALEKDDSDFFKHYDHKTDDTITRHDIAFPLVTDNNEPSRGGRPRIDVRGNDIRNNLALKLRNNELTRPLQEGMKYNRYGNIYMTY